MSIIKYIIVEVYCNGKRIGEFTLDSVKEALKKYTSISTDSYNETHYNAAEHFSESENLLEINKENIIIVSTKIEYLSFQSILLIKLNVKETK